MRLHAPRSRGNIARLLAATVVGLVAVVVTATPAAAGGVGYKCLNGDAAIEHTNADEEPIPGASGDSYYGIGIHRFYSVVNGFMCGMDAFAFMEIDGGPHWGQINVYLQDCWGPGTSTEVVENDNVVVEYDAPPTGLCSGTGGAKQATVFAVYGSTRLPDISIFA